MLTTGHTQIDAVLTTYRTILAETIDSLAGAQGQVAVLTADLSAARAALEQNKADFAKIEAKVKELLDAQRDPVMPGSIVGIMREGELKNDQAAP